MKKHFFIIIFLITSIVAFAQSPHTFSKVKYYTSDSVSSGEQIMGMVRHDSVIYMTIRTFLPGIGFSLNVVKTDIYGNLLKKIDLGTGYEFGSFIRDIDSDMMLVDRDSNLLIATQDWPGSPRRAVLIKLNRDLDTLWTKEYSLPDSLTGCHANYPWDSYFFALEQTPDNAYIITGTYVNCITSKRNLFLTKLDTSGNMIWVRTFDWVWSGYNINIAPDSGFIFSGHAGSSSQFVVTRTDKKGNIIWQDTVKKPNNYWLGGWLLGKTKTQLDSNNHIVSMAKFRYDYVDFNSYKTGIIIIKHDYNGNKLWEREYKPFGVLTSWVYHGAGLQDSPQMLVMPNNDIIISASAFVVHPFDSMIANFKGVLLKLDSQGDSLWARYYNVRHLADRTIFNDMLLLDDGGFLIGGYFEPFWENNWFGSLLVRTDSLGMTPAAHTLNVNEPLAAIDNPPVKTYPNPVGDVLNFDLDAVELNPHSFELTMYNIMGERVEQMDLTSGQTAVNVASLAPGVYFYRIYCSSTQKKYTGKFIKQ